MKNQECIRNESIDRNGGKVVQVVGRDWVDDLSKDQTLIARGITQKRIAKTLAYYANAFVWLDGPNKWAVVRLKGYAPYGGGVVEKAGAL